MYMYFKNYFQKSKKNKAMNELTLLCVDIGCFSRIESLMLEMAHGKIIYVAV